MTKAKNFQSSKSIAKAPTKQLQISDPPIAKKKKKKPSGVLEVSQSLSGAIVGSSSESEYRIVVEEAAARRQQELQEDPANRITEIKVYSFDSPLHFSKKEHKKRYDQLVKIGKAPKPQLFPHIKTLMDLEILDEVQSKFIQSGLGFIFNDDPGMHEKLVMEFFATFEPLLIKTPYHIEKVNSWNFWLGGEEWKVDSEVLNEWFGFPTDGEFPMFSDDVINAFYEKITGSKVWVSTQPSTCIRLPLWRLVHKFIAGNIYFDTLHGRFISKNDLKVMILMDQGRKVDWLWALTKGLLENQDLEHSNLGLGGGSFITHLAKKLNFDLGDRVGKKLDLNMKSMKSRQMLDKDGNWKMREDLPNLAKEMVEKKLMVLNKGKGILESEMEVDHENEIPRAPLSSDIPSSSHSTPHFGIDAKLDLILSRLTILASAHNELVSSHHDLAKSHVDFVTYSNSHNQWLEKTLMIIARDLGSSGIDLPPKSPFLPRSPSPYIPSPPYNPSSKGKAPVDVPLPSMSMDDVNESVRNVLESIAPFPREEHVARNGGGGGEVGVDHNEELRDERLTFGPEELHTWFGEDDVARVDETTITTPVESTTPEDVDLESESN